MIDFFGRPPIHRGVYFAGKTAMILGWVSFFMPLAGLDLSMFTQPMAKLVSFGLLAMGLVLFTLAGKYLGKSTRMGLPKEPTMLKTGGIYRFSRNPMYVSIYLVSIASALYLIHPFTAICALITILVHHRIILAEEAFLAERFGRDWTEYSKQVGRYF